VVEGVADLAGVAVALDLADEHDSLAGGRGDGQHDVRSPAALPYRFSLDRKCPAWGKQPAQDRLDFSEGLGLCEGVRRHRHLAAGASGSQVIDRLAV